MGGVRQETSLLYHERLTLKGILAYYAVIWNMSDDVQRDYKPQSSPTHATTDNMCQLSDAAANAH